MRLPSPSTVIACLALTVSLGTGGAYAATALKPNSVGSREIKNASIRPADMAPTARLSTSNRVFRQAVVDVTLDPSTQAAVNALAGAVKGEQGPGGPGGAAGDKGATGETGDAGKDGVTGLEVREGVNDIAPHGETAGARADCEPGERAISGGVRMEGGTQNAGEVQASYPVDEATGWEGIMVNVGSEPATVRAFAVCATVRP